MTDHIRDAVLSATDYLSAHPAEGRYTDSAATATIDDGLRCRIIGPGVEIFTDMPASVGGSDSAPSAGWLWRASQAACLATLIAMRAAVEGVVLTALEVTATSESDDRGILGIDDAIPAGPMSTNLKVHAIGDDEGVRAIVAWAAWHCPVTEAIGRVIPVNLELDLAQP